MKDGNGNATIPKGQVKSPDMRESVVDLTQNFQEPRSTLIPQSANTAVLAKLTSYIRKLESAYHRKEMLLQAANRSLAFASKELNSSGKELTKLNQSFKALMNSLGQGFLVFDSTGICGRLYSEACIDLLEGDPIGQNIADILQVPPEKREGFDGWIELLFSNTIDFEDLAALGPKTFPSLLGRQIELEFKPILNEEGEVVSVVMFATDLTEELQAKEEAQMKQNYAEMIVKITKDRNQFVLFIKKVREVIAMLANYASQHEKVNLTEIRRLLHTIKGGAASFYIRSIKNLAHRFETEIDEYIQSLGAGELESGTHEKLLPTIENYGVQLEMELANFLIEHQKLLGEEFEKEGYVRKIGISQLLDFSRKLQSLPGSGEISVTFLKDLVAVPISQSFYQFDSVIQTTAGRMGKKVNQLQFVGDDVVILPHLYENLFAAMVHVFTNSVVHGIETPDERATAGKNRFGTISVTVTHEKGKSEGKPIQSGSNTGSTGEWIDIKIEDDGRGVDPSAIRSKLKRMGVSSNIDSESDEDVIQHIFDAGVSTKETVNDVAGRGIGLNALLEEVVRLGGAMRVHSIVGKKTVFHLRIPYLWKERAE